MQATYRLHVQSPRQRHTLRNIERGLEFGICNELLAKPRNMARVEDMLDDLRRIRAEIQAEIDRLNA